MSAMKKTAKKTAAKTRTLSLPFEGGSDTSRMASETLSEEQISAQEQVVMAALRSRYRVKGRGQGFEASPPEEGGGMTDKEIEAHTGLLHESASARRRGLVIKGHVKDSGHMRRTPHGRLATVWVLGRQENLEDGGKNKYARRPSNAEIRTVLAFLEMPSMRAQQSEAVRKLAAWLRRIASEGA